MSGVSSVGGYSSYSNYSVISSGGAITNAAQDASGLAIAEKTETQTRGLDQGSQNMKDAKSVLNVEDGALDGITDYLQSIRELTIRAGNDTLSDEDKSYIQGQINQYLQGIDDIAKQTTFNEKHLLDGSNGNMTVSSDSDGTTIGASTHDSTVASLGLSGYDITSGNFSLDDIDNALATVQNSRTTVGSETNRIDHALNYNSRASLELNGFQMNKAEDRAIEALQEMKKKQALDQYQIMLQKKKMEDEEQRGRMFLM
ncbi:flagellin [Butyrivibrio sp. YAB3001]|uniref:flagellin n=1 Tax=Butyrivibrio sp. YAB3001 TaxID=1520812 RepID=UPI0008F61BA6|nr:flagellin FliC5 [Butyrivibrio sp. YAB3001]SFC94698.1 flagellin [Butyrivibrio sp. YAB3001]